MKEKAKLKLEYIIKELDETSRLPGLGSWKAQVEEKVELDDEETLRETYFNLNVIMQDKRALEEAMGKIIAGENILTQSLTNKGWMFWKQPLLSENKRKAVGSAFVRWSEAKVAQVNSLVENPANTDDTASMIIFAASMLDITSYCMQQLSSDLKEILADADNL